MANRTVLGAFDNTFVLRTSRPGFDVLSTGLAPQQVAFDSRFARAANVYASGVTRGTLYWDNMAAYSWANIQAPANLPYPPVVKSLFRHESRNEFCPGEYITDPLVNSYTPGNGLYRLVNKAPWALSNPYNGQLWGYFYWIILRSD
jgi:hypothetical protein